MAIWDDLRDWGASNPFNLPDPDIRLPSWFPRVSGRDLFSNKKPQRKAKLKYPVQQSNAIRGLGARQSTGQQENPLGSLYDMLIGMLTGPTGVDTSGLMDRVRGAYDPIYDARRKAIEDLMARTEQRTTAGRREIEGLYEGLGQDYERLAPEAAAQAEEARAQTEELFGQLKSNVEGNYSRIQGEQGDLLKKLGQEHVVGDVLEPQGEQAAAAMGRADELGAINQQRMSDIGNIDESYYRQGAPLARLAGTNKSADLLSQLNEFLGQRQSDISMLEGERTAGIQGSYNQLFSQAQAQAAQQKQQQTGMLFDLLQSQLQAANQPPPELTAGSFLGSLQPNLQQDVGTAFRSLERSPEAVYGRVEDPRHPVPGTFVPTTDEWWFNAVDDMYDKGQISDATRNALVQFLRLRLENQS